MTVGAVARDDATAAFFDGTAAGRFLLRRCPDGHYSEPAAVQCTTCAATELGWEPASGGATLVSWAVVWGETPTILVIAELDEGPWWWSQLTDPVAEPAVGQRLQLAFATGEDETVPVFVQAG
ncbi:MAG: Zn-ribbon domain-containing OB-fold protein [Streptosporangiaceae bacterium]